MATQKEIDDLLNDSLLASSSANAAGSKIRESVAKGQYQDSYANQQFEDYEQSKRSQGLKQSQSQIGQSRQMKKGKVLSAIKEQPSSNMEKRGTGKKGGDVTDFKTEQKFKKMEKTNNFPDKLHLAHNYARMQERERELLLTSLSEENKQLRNQLYMKNNELKTVSGKYKVLLEEKTENNTTAKELALQKKVSVLEQKLKKVTHLKKIQGQRNKYANKISNKPQNFIPQQEASRRQSQLLELIDKLKERLINSDENLAFLNKKLHQQQLQNDELHVRMKRVEQLEYKIEKMTEQAQTDRGYIDLLKEKIKEYENKLQQEKNKLSKLQIEMKRLEMGQYTHSDLLEQLKETRKQKEMLEKSLKQLSSTMIGNVRKGINKPSEGIEDSNQLLKA